MLDIKHIWDNNIHIIYPHLTGGTKMSKIKLIAFDLDGTLTQHKTKLDPVNRSVLESLAKKYKCHFATPEFSGDNAAGTALLTKEKFEEI